MTGSITNYHGSAKIPTYHNTHYEAATYTKESSFMPTRTVLVVDDDPDIRDLIAQTLDDEGYHVVSLGDGEMAVSLAQAEPPALILLDLMMPTTSGWEVLRKLRAHPATVSVPVVLVSASRELAVAQGELGASGSIAKPFDLDRLIDTVQAFIGRPNEHE